MYSFPEKLFLRLNSEQDVAKITSTGKNYANMSLNHQNNCHQLFLKHAADDKTSYTLMLNPE